MTFLLRSSDQAALQTGPSANMSRSLLFTAASSQYLTRTGNASANKQKFTIGFWIKRTSTGAASSFYSISDGTSLNRINFQFMATNVIDFVNVTANSTTARLTTNETITDTAAFHFVLLNVDTTQATAANRMTIEIDGVPATYSTATYPTQNANLSNAFANTAAIGVNVSNVIGTNCLNGKVAEFRYIDGQTLSSSSFITGTPGSPKPFAGSYTGVFDTYLPFCNPASTTTLGADSSGEGNNWTLTNMTTANSSTDYPS